MIDVAKSLNLVEGGRVSTSPVPSASSKKKKPAGLLGSSDGKSVVQGVGRPRNKRELETEQRKLKKEVDKLLKAHEKATKILDDHRNDHKNDRYPVEDEVVMEEDQQKSASVNSTVDLGHLCNPDLDGFPGIPVECTPDLIMVWDFLCTFSRPLSLQPIALDDFAAALSQRPLDALSSPPLYLAEAHLALLKLLLNDPTSDEWWWSTLETKESEAEEGKGAVEYSSKRRVEQLIPVIKCDLAAMLAVEEDIHITSAWLQALDDVRTKKPNSVGPIKSAVKNAISITTNALVKTYLKKGLRFMRPNSAGLTKRAAVWLVERVREARPDLWRRKVMKDEVVEQAKIVAEEVALYMDQVDENANVEAMNAAAAFENDDIEEDSDEDEDDVVSDDEDDEDDQDATATNGDTKSASVPRKSIDALPVSTDVPPQPSPTIVDLLLPPSKPTPGSDIVSPFTWPCIAGAVSCRILHYYKRKRNHVDDSLREFRELPPLTVGERRRREANANNRILSESFSISKLDSMSVDCAIQHLCSGKSFAELSQIQKLCILRILVEASYDSDRVRSCIEDNINSRQNAMKALEAERRRAKKEAREEAAAAEAAARERLVKESREALIQKKRREITRLNKKTQEFTTEFIEGLTDDDIAEFDDETKSEFAALPGPSNFSRSNVQAMVAKIHEEDAFDADTLVVLTLEEIEAREEEILANMQQELSGMGDEATVYARADRETSKKFDSLRNEISDFKESILSLPALRASAMDGLKDAIEDGTIKALKTAIKNAEMAWLSGHDEESDGIWALDLLRDAALELKSAERRKRVTMAQKDLIAKRNKCFVRTEPIGTDRHRNRFWHFDTDEDGRVWTEANYVLRDRAVDAAEDEDNDENLFETSARSKIGADDEENDFLSPELLNNDTSRDSVLLHSRREYHSSGSVSSLVKRHWGCHATNKSLRGLIKNLDGRGIREMALKESLKETVEAIAASASTAEGGIEQQSKEQEASGKDSKKNENKGINEAAYQTTGDEEQFTVAIESSLQASSSTRLAFDLLEPIASALGQRVRLRQTPDPSDNPNYVVYEMGTVTGWKFVDPPPLKMDGNGSDGADSKGIGQETDSSAGGKIPVWRLAVDCGGESQLIGSEVVEGISRFLMWRTQYEGYSEELYNVVEYRNSLGRFCGRAADAPYASSPAFLAKLMIKKEQELYPPLKNRVYENNWGGKSGERNAWILSVKEYGHKIETLRNGLLTLEEAFFGFCGGLSGITEDSSSAQPEDCSAKELLSDEKQRFDIELESFGKASKSLWNTEKTRNIFREIVASSNTVGTLALCLALLCRNARTYLDASKPTVSTRTATNNQTAVFEQPELYWGQSRRSASRQQSYSQFFD